MTGTPWLVRRERRPGADADLYCFPHSGGAPGEYVRWSDGLPAIQVYGVQLPGRASRLTEAPFTRMSLLVDAIAGEVPFERPFVLFGHSLGALVAFEVARALRERGGPQPEQLFLSACPPPPPAAGRPPLHRLPDAELLAAIERFWGPLPASVSADPDLLVLALSCFRADLEVLETYRYARGTPLGCPITAIGGADDPNTSRLHDWRTHTTGSFDLRVLPGGHFYFRDRQRDLLDVIRDAIAGDRAVSTREPHR